MTHDEGVYRAHTEQFAAIHAKLESLGERMAALGGTVERLDGEIFNHGRDGMKTTLIKLESAFEGFLKDQTTAREERQRADELRQRKADRHIQLLIGVMAVFTVLIALLLYVHTVEADRKGLLHWPKFNLTQDSQEHYAHVKSEPQSAAE